MMNRNFLDAGFILGILLLGRVQKMPNLFLRKVRIFAQVA